MRNLMAGCGVIALCLIIAGVMLARKSKAALFPGVLVEQVDRLTAGWAANNTPETDRVVDLIISDAQEEAAQERPAETSGAYSSEDLEVLASGVKPSATAKLGTWFRRTFFRRTMKAPEDTAFVEALANKPGAVVWTHKGEETASEDEMTREFMRAILKADDAGAVVNIVTQGRAAAAAFRAIKLLQKAKRPDGHMPTVAKVVAVNMNRPTLKRINSGLFSNFSKPENLREIVYIWNPPAEPKRTMIEAHTPKYNGVRWDGGELLPMMGGRGGGAQDVLRFIEVLEKKIYTMEAVVGHLAEKVEAKKEVVRAAARAEAQARVKAEAKKTYTAEVVKRDLMGRVVGKAAPKPVDSLSAIGGGWLKKEAEKAEKEKKQTQKENKPAQTRTKRADNKSGNRANCTGNPPYCNWWDARAYCGGSLPSVAQLKAWYNSECAGGRKGSIYCNRYVWSGESTSASSARFVTFRDGDVHEYGKYSNINVRCR